MRNRNKNLWKRLLDSPFAWAFIMVQENISQLLEVSVESIETRCFLFYTKAKKFIPESTIDNRFILNVIAIVIYNFLPVFRQCMNSIPEEFLQFRGDPVIEPIFALCISLELLREMCHRSEQVVI